MQIVAYPCLMMAAITLYLSGYHLVMFLKRRAARTHLPFSLLCLSVAAYDLFCVGLYSSRSLVEGIPWQRLQLHTVNAISACTIWFVASYVGKLKHNLPRLLIAWFGLLFVLSVALPPELGLSPLRPAVRTVQVFGRISATYYEGEVGSVYLVALLSSVLAYAYMLKLLIDHYRETRHHQTPVIIAGQVTFFVGVLCDTLASARVHSYLYVGEYAFLLVVLSMAYVLLDEFVGLYAAVEEANRGLELRVAERTSALARRNGEMRLVLDTVSQGLVTIDRDGKVSGERSATFDRWFGAPPPDSPFSSHLARADPKLEVSLRLGWVQVVDNVLPLELSIQQIPQRMGIGETSYALAFTPILDSGEVSGALVTISDVTAQEAAQRAEIAEREFARAFERAVHDRHGFRAFLGEVSQLVRQIVVGKHADVVDVLRGLHTIKGNCSVFGVASVADVAHELESIMVDDPRELEKVDFRRLDEAWSRFTKRLAVLVELKAENLVEVSHAELDELAQAARGPSSREHVAEAVLALKHDPVAICFDRFKQQIEALAQRLGKPIPTVIAKDAALRLPAGRWAPFWSAFVHVLRNAVDHGVEPPEIRRRAGKVEAGTVTLEARAEGVGVTIEVRDDGRGIDWSAVKTRAEIAGLATADHAALVDALFADGVSTAAEVTPTSGRGVGLAAVREAVRGLRGSIEVTSVMGQGTTFTFRFPSGTLRALE
jgi:two-component system, chemotaxis family, sensor kinase CheA